MVTLAAQGAPKFCSAGESASYEESRALRAALEEGLTMSIPFPCISFRC